MIVRKHALATIELIQPSADKPSEPLTPRTWRVDIRIGDDTSAYYTAGVEIEQELSPGETQSVYLAFGNPTLVAARLQVGTPIFYCPGPHIAKGRILELYFSDDERNGGQ